MKISFTPEANRQATEKDDWWRLHRPDSPGLFARELAEATGLVQEAQGLGALYVTRRGMVVRRLLLPKTRNHLYYLVDPNAELVIVLAVWGAPRGRPPQL